jgi:hypothetical protein
MASAICPNAWCAAARFPKQIAEKGRDSMLFDKAAV